MPLWNSLEIASRITAPVRDINSAQMLKSPSLIVPPLKRGLKVTAYEGTDTSHENIGDQALLATQPITAPMMIQSRKLIISCA